MFGAWMEKKKKILRISIFLLWILEENEKKKKLIRKDDT